MGCSNSHAPLLIIGAGPGGYAAAFLAADLGLKVTLIDQEKKPGGVCLFRGCIPSKALLHIAKILSDTKEAKEIGIDFRDPHIDISKICDWKNGIVTKLTDGLGQLTKQRNITFIQGHASFLNETTVHVKTFEEQDLAFTFDNVILATGSRPTSLPFAPPAPRIFDSTAALNLKNIPEKLLVIGGGYIGLELGTVYQALGSAVTVVEMTSTLLPGADRDLSSNLQRRLKQNFEAIRLNTKVTALKETKKGVLVSLEDDNNQIQEEEYDNVLIAIGRKPNIENLGLDRTKIELTEKGFIKISSQGQTTSPSIYAIGDIAGEPMLAHKASHQGRVAVEAISGKEISFNPKAIPAVVFTNPEIAWCGLTESQAKTENKKVKITKFPWAASGRAMTLNRTEGSTKLIIDPETELILGMAIIGPGAGDMIAEGVLAIEMGATAKNIALTIHPHPTLSETIMEAAEIFYGQCTHIYRPKRK